MPSPFFSAFSSNSSAPACSIAERSGPSVNAFCGDVKCSDFDAFAIKVIPFSRSGRLFSSLFSDSPILPSNAFQPDSRTVLPVAVNAVFSHSSVTFTASYRYVDAEAHKSLRATSFRIFCSPTASADTSHFTPLSVGMIA